MRVQETEGTSPFISKGQLPRNLTSLVIEGKRLCLKSINAGYAQEVFTEFTAEVTRFMFPRPAEKIEETLAFITRAIDGMNGGGDLTLAIVLREGSEFIGCCGLHGRGKPMTPELGVWLKKSAHGHKYGREAIWMLVSWAFANVAFDYLIYPADRANIPSRKIPESLGGLLYEEKKVKSMAGNILDEVFYKITAESLKRLPILQKD